MTYVELIVVLSIFAVMSSIVVFNYGEFQAKVDIKNLASDIALKIVEAQKSAVSGKLIVNSLPPPDWKPAYGVYFNSSSSYDDDGSSVFNKKFIYFADFDGQKNYTGMTYSCAGECLDIITITKNNYISAIDVCIDIPCVNVVASLPSISITFTRPDSGAVFFSNHPILPSFDYVQITVKSPLPKKATATIKIYHSGRVQVN